jgi:hypothetical protein
MPLPVPSAERVRWVSVGPHSYLSQLTRKRWVFTQSEHSYDCSQVSWKVEMKSGVMYTYSDTFLVNIIQTHLEPCLWNSNESTILPSFDHWPATREVE